METKFTEEKWTIEYPKKQKHYAKISGTTWTDFAKVVVRLKGSSELCDEGVANAKLIAAAPDLFKVCCLVLDEWHSKTSNMYKKEPIFVQLAREAIRKATE